MFGLGTEFYGNVSNAMFLGFPSRWEVLEVACYDLKILKSFLQIYQIFY